MHLFAYCVKTQKLAPVVTDIQKTFFKYYELANKRVEGACVNTPILACDSNRGPTGYAVGNRIWL